MIPEIRIWMKDKKKMGIVCMLDYDIQEVDYKGNISGGWLKWDQVVFMADTGHVDSTGKTIFEGDILERTGAAEKTREIAKFPMYVELRHGSDYTVIGNVWENPELAPNV